MAGLNNNIKQVSRNWPPNSAKSADILQKDLSGNFSFANQSDDIPQPLKLIPFPSEPTRHHPLFDIQGTGGSILQHFSGHMHEGETLWCGGAKDSVPWTIDDALTFEGGKVIEYPVRDGHQEQPRIITMGTVIPDHTTPVEPNKLCESGFRPEPSKTEAKHINTLSAYDGQKVGVGRVLTDSSFHHVLDLNLLGDPCATGHKTRGFQNAFLSDMEAFFMNCVAWLANSRHS